MKFEDTPVVVEARFDADGTITPLTIAWRGQMLPIGDVGRSWTSTGGTLRYWLVMVPTLGTLELCLDTAALLWRITRAWKRPTLA